MTIGVVETAGDDDLATGNVSLRSRAGSIVDALNDAAADVLGQTIDIDAHGGSIGQVAERPRDRLARAARAQLRPHGRRPGRHGDDVALEARTTST